LITASLALKLCGFLYFFILVTSAASAGLGNRNDETDAASKLTTISENPGQYRMSVNIAIISHLGIVAITGMLFLAFSSYNRQLALIGSVFCLGEGLVLLYNEISVLRLLEMAMEYALNDLNKNSIRVLGDQILQTKNTRFLLDLFLLAIGALVYCIMFVQSGAVLSLIAWLGLAAGIVTAIGIFVHFASGYGAVYVIGMLSMMVFEVVFGGWLLLYSIIE
jgi:hypothetical protein